MFKLYSPPTMLMGEEAAVALTWIALEVTRVPGATPVCGENEYGATWAKPARGAHRAHTRAHRLKLRQKPGNSELDNIEPPISSPGALAFPGQKFVNGRDS